MKDIMVGTAADSFYLTCTEMMKEISPIFLSCDKGHLGGDVHFVEKIVDGAKKTRELKFPRYILMIMMTRPMIVLVLVVFVRKIFFDLPVVLSGHTTDSGGGGTGTSFASALEGSALTC